VPLLVQGAPAKLRQLAALYGVEELLGLQGSVA
jgi:ABC-type transporter Mla MlaB component